MRNRVLAAGVMVAATLHAQVFVVDAANGAGAHFTDLPAAVAAVPDGATLRVRAGAYAPFTLTGKGLRVVGEGAVTLGAGDVVITGTRRDQVILLRDLVLPTSGQVLITDTVGPVVLERCHRDTGIGFPLASDVVVLRGANLQLLGCNFDSRFFLGSASEPPPTIVATDSQVTIAACRVVGNDGYRTTFTSRAGPGGAALALLRTRAVLSRSTLDGGQGGPGCRSCGIGCYADGGTGGPACRAVGATLVLLDTVLRGGTGGPPGCCSTTQQCSCPGDGGPGLLLENSLAYLLGQQPAGGPPAGTTCSAQWGPPIQQAGTNTLHVNTAARPPLARVDGTQATQQSISFTVLSPAGSIALMGIAYDGALAPIEPVGFGSLLAGTVGYVGPFVVPPGDALQLPWIVPAGFALGQVHFGQFLTLAGGILFASNPFPLVVAQ